MKVAIVAAVLCLVAVSSVVAGGGKGGKHMKHMQCKGKDLTFDEASKTAMKECWKEAKDRKKSEGADDTEEDKKKKWMDPCIMVCKFTKAGVIVDGKINGDEMAKQIDKFYPEEARAELKTEAQKCVDESKDATISMDNNCESFAPFQKCYFKANHAVCKTEEAEH